MTWQVDILELSSPSQRPKQCCTVMNQSAPSCLSFNPTSPDILFVGSSSGSSGIYNVGTSSNSPAISCSTDIKGLWYADWAPDGKLLATISKSGHVALFDPRASSDAIKSRALPIQPIKPSRIVWVGEHLLVTSFSKTRNREYLVLNPDLSTKATQTIDTNTSPLIPLVDHERQIVYLAGRGDMTLRQVELSGPQGFQETIHPLPSPLLGGMGLASPTALDVMTAEIARLFMGQFDKDGEAIVALSINVPRRQLIDFHPDLYPEVMGTSPEQTADEWIKGDDRVPLSISLDPSRRSQWEQDLTRNGMTSSSAVEQKIPEAKPTPLVPKSESAGQATPKEAAQPEQTTPGPQAPKGAIETMDGRSPPKPIEGQTFATTGYKARLVSDYIGSQLSEHRLSKKAGPLMVGLQGPQGCGKTTLCDALLEYLRGERKLRVAVLSIDGESRPGYPDVGRTSLT